MGSTKNRAVKLSLKNMLATFGLILFGFVCSAGTAAAGSTQTGVIAAVSADYSSSAVSIASVDPKAGPRSVWNNLLPSSSSDTGVVGFGQYYYRIERFQSDNITKVDVGTPNRPIWQYSTQDSGESNSSNPRDLVFVNSKKAYLIRYGSAKAWIVNPSATSQAAFKTGELDLSAYADADGVPEMVGGVIANGKLFIILQRLDSSFCPSNTSYVAVFDVVTDTEIDTGKGEGAVKGIPLSIRNPKVIQYTAENNLIYIQGVGSFPGMCDPAYDYMGGIEAMNPVSYDTAMVLDDGTSESHPYGQINGMLILSPTQGYFVGYAAWGDNTLYAFNPGTGEVSGALEGFQNINIGGGMESGLYLDKNNMMWVSDNTDATVKIVDTTTDTLNESLATNLNPGKVSFCVSGTPLAPQIGYSVSGNSLMIYWNMVSGAEGYYLWAAQPATGWSALFNWGSRNSLSATVSSGSTFYVSVIPYNASGSGAASSVVQITVP